MRQADYSFYKFLPGATLADAEEKVTVALKREGFGVLTRIDVKDTLKKKIDVDFRPYLILGACNPRLAHRALSQDDTVGLLLPCNVVVAQKNDGAEIALARPQSMFEAVKNPDVQPLADEAEERIRRVFESL
jgi:uncharacterized protein (DUF302 family)